MKLKNIILTSVLVITLLLSFALNTENVMASPEIMSMSTNQGTGSVISVNTPAGTSEGDLIIVFIGTRDGGSIVPGDPAFNTIRQEVYSNDKDRPITAAFYVIENSVIPTNYIFNRITDDDREWKVVAFRITNFNVFEPIGNTIGITNMGTSTHSLTIPDLELNNIKNPDNLVFSTVTTYRDNDFINHNTDFNTENFFASRPANKIISKIVPQQPSISDITYTFQHSSHASAIAFEVNSYEEPISLHVHIEEFELLVGENNFISWQTLGDTETDYFEINITHVETGNVLFQSFQEDDTVFLQNLNLTGKYRVYAFINDTFGNEYIFDESFEVIPRPLFDPEQTFENTIILVISFILLSLLFYISAKNNVEILLYASVFGLIVISIVFINWIFIVGIIMFFISLLLMFLSIEYNGKRS